LKRESTKAPDIGGLRAHQRRMHFLSGPPMHFLSGVDSAP